MNLADTIFLLCCSFYIFFVIIAGYINEKKMPASELNLPVTQINMPKIISLLVVTKHQDIRIEGLVKSAINKAIGKETIQFIFYVDKSDRVTVNLTHKLYQKYPVSIFDIDSSPTIKNCTDNSLTYSGKIRRCLEKADGRLIGIIDSQIEFIEGWDSLAMAACSNDSINFLKMGVHNMYLFNSHVLLEDSFIEKIQS